MCRICIAVANTNSQIRDSTSGSSSNEHSDDTKSSSESPSASRTGGHTSPSDPLQQILEKLSTLGSLDKRITEMQTSFDKRFSDLQSSFVTRFEEVKTTLNTRLDEVSTRMTNLEERLTPLDDLPLISTRLSAAEEAIAQVQSEQANLRREYGEFCSANSVAASDGSAVRRIEKLERVFENLNAAQRNLSSELVITGLQISDTTSLKGAVYAALKLLDGGLLERDILNIRKMRLKPPLVPPTPSDTHAEELRNDNAEESSTIAHDSSTSTYHS